MKRTLLLLSLAVAFLSQASAQTITVTGSNMTVSPGQIFNVTIQLSVSQALSNNVTALNLLLATPSSGANSGVNLFTVKYGSGSADFPTSTGNGTTVSNFNTAGTGGNAGFNISTPTNDLGANAGGGAGRTAPFSNVTVDLLQFTVAANTPQGVYNFRATLPGTNTNERTFINVAGNGGPDTGGTYNINSAPTFTITVVPEPSTWAFLILGAGCAGLVVLRRRRTA